MHSVGSAGLAHLLTTANGNEISELVRRYDQTIATPSECVCLLASSGELSCHQRSTRAVVTSPLW